MLQFILIVLFIYMVLWSLARFVGFVLFNHRAGSLASIRDQLGGLGWPLCRGMLTAVMAEVIAVGSYPLGWFREFKREGAGTPIIMVHGLFHNASAWALMLRRLEQAGFSNLDTYQYNCLTESFDQAVAGMQQKLDSVLGAYPDGKVILMGHSLGGLVCRAVAGNPDYQERIAGLVTLGSPHNGAALAFLGPNGLSRGLLPGRFIPTTVDKLPDPECPKLAIYSLVDDFVYPLSMLKPNRPDWIEIICSPMAHVWMLYSKEVSRLVVGFLRKL